MRPLLRGRSRRSVAMRADAERVREVYRPRVHARHTKHNVRITRGKESHTGPQTQLRHCRHPPDTVEGKEKVDRQRARVRWRQRAPESRQAPSRAAPLLGHPVWSIDFFPCSSSTPPHCVSRPVRFPLSPTTASPPFTIRVFSDRPPPSFHLPVPPIILYLPFPSLRVDTAHFRYCHACMSFSAYEWVICTPTLIFSSSDRHAVQLSAIFAM